MMRKGSCFHCEINCCKRSPRLWKYRIPSKKRSLRKVNQKMTPMQKFHKQLLLEWRRYEKPNESSPEDVLIFDRVNNFIPENEIGLGAILLKPIGSDGKATRKTSLETKPQSSTNEAREEANKFTPNHPFFTVNMTPNQRVHVPISFVTNYLEKKDQIVMLQVGQKSWPIKLLYYSTTSQGHLSRGWSLFAKENKLQSGDACVFELINREDVVFNVHVFRGHSGN